MIPTSSVNATRTPTPAPCTDAALLAHALDETDTLRRLTARTGIAPNRLRRIALGAPAKEVERRAMQLVIERKL